jgi:hypothetical protein
MPAVDAAAHHDPLPRPAARDENIRATGDRRSDCASIAP